MNTTTQTPPSLASTFEALVYTVRTYPESYMADVHAVNLVSQLAAMPEGKACVAIVCAETFSRYVGLERSTLPTARLRGHAATALGQK